jgi:hypothetical protein
MSSRRLGTSFCSGTRRRISPRAARYCSTARRMLSTLPLARSAFAFRTMVLRLSISVCVADARARCGPLNLVQAK